MSDLVKAFDERETIRREALEEAARAAWIAVANGADRDGVADAIRKLIDK